jgi:hypothetical protein
MIDHARDYLLMYSRILTHQMLEKHNNVNAKTGISDISLTSSASTLSKLTSFDMGTNQWRCSDESCIERHRKLATKILHQSSYRAIVNQGSSPAGACDWQTNSTIKGIVIYTFMHGWRRTLPSTKVESLQRPLQEWNEGYFDSTTCLLQ